jgi:hypothetical protein
MAGKMDQLVQPITQFEDGTFRIHFGVPPAANQDAQAMPAPDAGGDDDAVSMHMRLGAGSQLASPVFSVLSQPDATDNMSQAALAFDDQSDPLDRTLETPPSLGHVFDTTRGARVHVVKKTEADPETDCGLGATLVTWQLKDLPSATAAGDSAADADEPTPRVKVGERKVFHPDGLQHCVVSLDAEGKPLDVVWYPEGEANADSAVRLSPEAWQTLIEQPAFRRFLKYTDLDAPRFAEIFGLPVP